MQKLWFAVVAVVALLCGFVVAQADKVTQASPAYDWLMAKLVQKTATIELTGARQGTEIACLLAPHTDGDKLAATTKISPIGLWQLRRLIDADSHGVVLIQGGQVTDAFLLRSDSLRDTDAASLEGQCGARMALHATIMEPARAVQPKAALSGQKQEINWALYANPDCTPGGVPTIVIATQPEHGRVTVEAGGHYPTYDKNNIRWRCNLREMPALLVYYQSAPGFVGADRVAIDVVFPDGKMTRWDHPINVR